jgi:hypothetical protein
LSAALKFKEISGQYKNFTRMAPADFVVLINLVRNIKELQKKRLIGIASLLFQQST